MSKPHVAIFVKVPSSKEPCPPYGGHGRKSGGLATNAQHSEAVLREMGVDCQVYHVCSYAELVKTLQKHPATHCVIEAIWVTLAEVKELHHMHPEMKLVVRAHSKIGFLQVEPEAIPTIRQIIEFSLHKPNVWFSSNNEEFANSMEEAYGRCLYLPNLYDLAAAPPRQKIHGNLRIASFGASRLLKLHPSAALAALQVADRLDRDLDFFINQDKTPGGDSVRKTVRNLLAGLPGVKLHEVSWQDAETFKETIASMDLVFQTSATETFCMVAADAVASGVPVVTGPAVAWVPAGFVAPIDDTDLLATAAVCALRNEKESARVELKSLNAYVKDAKDVWVKFLGLQAKRPWWKF